jgi:hypothetical protein
MKLRMAIRANATYTLSEMQNIGDPGYPPFISVSLCHGKKLILFYFYNIIWEDVILPI